jgi:methyl-accepting chemotaxis protein PixJ
VEATYRLLPTVDEVCIMTQTSSQPTLPVSEDSNALSEFQTTEQSNGSFASDWEQSEETGDRLSQMEDEERNSSPLSDKAWAPLGWWQDLSVRTKAAALAFIIGTAPVLAIGGIAYNFSNRSAVQQTEESARTRVVDLQDKVNQFMRDRFSDIQVMASMDILIDPALRSSTSTRDKEAALTRIMKSSNIYDSILVTDMEGNVTARTAGSPSDNLFDRDYFQATVKANGPTLSQPQIARSSKIFSVFASSIIKDKATGAPIGFIRARMPVKSLVEVLQNYEAPGTQSYLIDGNGGVFIGPEGLFTPEGAKEGINEPAKELKPADPSSIFRGFDELKNANQVTAILSSNAKTDTEQLLAYAPPAHLKGLPDLGWRTVIATDLTVAFAPQRQLLLTLTAGIGITTLLMAALAAAVANRVTRPLLSAAEAVEKIGQGDLDTRLVVQGGDEIASLGSNINNMAIRLQNVLDLQAFEVEQERLLTAAKGSGVLRAEDLQDIFDQAVAGARSLLGLDRVVIYRFEAGPSGGIASEAVDAAWSSALMENISDSCIPEEVREAYRQGRVAAIKDVSEAELHPDHLKLLERLQVKASLVVPILAGGWLFGLLVAHSCGKTYDWQELEINFFKRLSTELGLSIYRVELLEQMTNLAEEQRQLKEGLQKRALELLQEVDPVSRGDLTIRAKVTVDEIGTIADSYNSTIDSLRKIVLQVQEAADQVAETTSTNETSIQSLSTEALRQAEEVSAALNLVREMTEAVQAVAANAEQAEEAVQQAAQTVEEGDSAMNRTVEGIQAIRATVADTAKKVKHLGESSQKISKVVELISAFAAQTNMLALNASIEASRAGEEGKGFAVVANEVRTLARQSAEATEEIRKLVASIQAETSEVVTAMESGIEQVVIGTKLVDDTRQSLNKITTASSQISELVRSITQVTTDQSQASETVAQTMKEVAAIANKTSTEVNQVSSSFKQLRRVAQMLQTGIGQFKV